MVDINKHLESFSSQETSPSTKTVIEEIKIGKQPIKRYVNEFWTAGQRKASSIHEVSYRACFKPQLPGFFIDLLTKPGEVVYDPFSGRGTTVVEAALKGRKIISNDINPLSRIFTQPRLSIPGPDEIQARLEEIDLSGSGTTRRKNALDLSMFYHPSTETELSALRDYLSNRAEKENEDKLDRWIRMAATSRLTGHSKGFFSVYSLPPNQAVSQKSQIKINERLGQKPDHREVKPRILKKTKSLLRNLKEDQIANLHWASRSALFLEEDSRNTSRIPASSVALTVTSPPFLDIVQYSGDNWLRCWFNGLDVGEVQKRITVLKDLDRWSQFIGGTFNELYRITKKNGWVAFEVGEIRKGKLELDKAVIPLGKSAGFTCKGVMMNSQNFTKTSNIWGVSNMKGGTNTNRIVIFKKEA